MQIHCPNIEFERYADDIVCHCRSEYQSIKLKASLEERFKACGLTLHPEKTKMVYCKSERRRGNYPVVCFDFLGYTFGPKYIRTRSGKRGVYFIATISQKAAKHIRDQIKQWPWSYWYQQDLDEIRQYCQDRIKGWLNYYRLFGVHYIKNILFNFDKRLARWAKHKFKGLQTVMQSARYVNDIRQTRPTLFAHW